MRRERSFFWMLRSRLVNAFPTALFCALFLLPLFWLSSWAFWGWLVVVLLFSCSAIWSAWTDVAWLPTPMEDIANILRLSQLRSGDIFVDLGAGDARVLIAIQRATNAVCVGYERSLFHYTIGCLRVWASGAPVQLRFGDLHEAELWSARVAYVWGSDHLMTGPLFTRLAGSFPEELRLLARNHPLVGRAPVSVEVSATGGVFYVYDGVARSERRSS